ncbi:hypothetical protein BD413DRAFT_617824 [Trametes elegans]|nr:hypothetical protein BD413DRAFT_617824 [Trametes elegans]
MDTQQQYAAPRPQHALPVAGGSKTQCLRQATPLYGSPASTPSLSDVTSESSWGHLNACVEYDEENLIRTLGLSQHDIDYADPTTWKAPSFAAWLTQRRAQEAFEQHANATARPGPSSGTPLNPNAGEFIPVTTRTQAAKQQAASDAEPKDEEMLRLRHPWTAKFRAGSVTRDANVRREYAKEIVHMGRWDAHSMQALGGKFAERAMEAYGESLQLVAPFAKATHDAFRRYGGPTCAASFKISLMQFVWVEFEAFWDANRRSSLMQYARKLMKDPWTPAISLASFVAELFTHQLVHAGFVYRCLHMLVDDMQVIEQLRGTRVLMTRLDYRLLAADRPAMENIIHAIKHNVRRVVFGHSALGEAVDVGVVKAQSDAIIDAANRWASIATANTPQSFKASRQGTPAKSVFPQNGGSPHDWMFYPPHPSPEALNARTVFATAHP